MQLNREQQLAVDSRNGRILVSAAPGSGKTRVIVERVLAILAQGLPPRNILSTTFTREASEEMQNRAARYLLKVGKEKVPQAWLDKAKRDFGLEVPYGHHVFCTFHSLALRFVKTNQRNHFPHLASHVLASGSETGRALRTAMKMAGIQPCDKKELVRFISKCKRKRITPEQSLEHDEFFSEAYGHYESALHDMGLLDFDSLLVCMADLLEANDEVRAKWQFQYVQVDEAQDTDALQWTIVDKMTQKYGNLLAVGDENQGMYSFRGSESNLQANFEARYPGAQVLVLPENYRSSGAIVKYIKDIAPLKNATVENLRTANATGKPIVFTRHDNEEHEAASVLRRVIDIPNTAILTRTNAQLQPFEDACTNASIPFHVLGKGGFWRQHEVETCMAYVRCLVSPTEKSLQAVIRSPYSVVKAKKTEKDAVIEWLSKARRGGINERKLLSGLRQYPYYPFNKLPDMFNEVSVQRSNKMRILFERAGVVGYYRAKDEDKDDTPDNNRLENISRLLTIAEKFNGDMLKFLQFAERVRRENKSSKEVMTLSTIHKAKGLEWKDVFVAGVNEGKLPSSYAVNPEELEEEARVYYVACSRAARSLHVSCSGVPSQFIDTVVVSPVTEEVDFLKTMLEMAEGAAE